MSDEFVWTPKARAILDAANELFYAHGIHAVGVESIAERAGVTKKTLYDRFGSKERLVVIYLTERDRRWHEYLDRRLDAAGSDPAARLGMMFDAAAAWTGDHGGKGCATINAHAELSDPSHPAYPVLIEQKKWVLALFRDLAVEAGAQDPERVAGEIMLLHEGALVTAGMNMVDDPFTNARDAALRRLAAG